MRTLLWDIREPTSAWPSAAGQGGVWSKIVDILATGWVGPEGHQKTGCQGAPLDDPPVVMIVRITLSCSTNVPERSLCNLCGCRPMFSRIGPTSTKRDQTRPNSAGLNRGWADSGQMLEAKFDQRPQAQTRRQQPRQQPMQQSRRQQPQRQPLLRRLGVAEGQLEGELQRHEPGALGEGRCGGARQPRRREEAERGV